MINQYIKKSNIEKKMETTGWTYDTSNNFTQPLYNDSYYNQFKPLNMFYINKYIKIHPGATKYYKEINFINNKNSECNLDSLSCNLMPNRNLKKIYWKYDKLPGLLSDFKLDNTL